ncbi:MAG: uracil-DNA glycosylase [Celeribacter sp.]|jgi:DNA polymerase
MSLAIDQMDFHTARALLEWQVELGVLDAVGETPVDRYAASAEALAQQAARQAERQAGQPGQSNTQAGGQKGREAGTRAKPGRAPGPPLTPKGPDTALLAEQAAQAAGDLAALAAAQEGFDHCDLKRGARSFVFADGRPEARVMIIGESPGAEEDRAGRPFVGQAGRMLDRMFAAIGLTRDAADAEQAFYVCNVLPWRPPQNRDPQAAEVAMMLPFVKRHIALVDPDLLVLMGNHPCGALLGKRGITRLRGQWAEVEGRPALPMFHPAYLLRNPDLKREAWADLLNLQARLRDKKG